MVKKLFNWIVKFVKQLLGIKPEYLLKFYSGAKVVNRFFVKAGNNVKLIDMGKTGHTFTGWSDKDTSSPVFSGQKQSGTFVMPGRNVELVANYQVNSWNYTVNLDGGSATGGTASGTKNYGTAITLPTNPTRGGYSFVQWTRSDTGGHPASGSVFSMPDNDVTLTAEWYAIPATTWLLSYDSAGGSSITGSPFTIADGSTVAVVSQIPAKTGFDFGGWERSDNSQILQPGASITVTANLTLTAVWYDSDYALYIDWNGGSDPQAGNDPFDQGQNWQYGSAVVIHSSWIPSRSGYTFAGFKRNDTGDLLQEGQSFTMPANDVTLIAQWTPVVVQTDGTLQMRFGSSSGSTYPKPIILNLHLANASSEIIAANPVLRIHYKVRYENTPYGDEYYAENTANFSVAGLVQLGEEEVHAEGDYYGNANLVVLEIISGAGGFNVDVDSALSDYMI